MDETIVENRNRFFDLLSTFSVLRSNGQALVDQIRGSLNEMRQLRTGLRSQHDPLTEPERNGRENGHSNLRLLYGLTSREAEVAILLVQGRSNSAIAEQLKISPHTARHHTQRILVKLEVHSRAAAGAKLRNL
jgi:DNA-binding NarL/FixJ family response regulator